jgi:5-formyltetrahydrofolate cyclo-ligase
LKNNKEPLKKKILLLRRGMHPFDVLVKSWQAQENFLNSLFFSKSEVIGAYYPILNEVQTFRIIHECLLVKKTVCLPKLLQGEIVFFSITTLNDLETGSFNIKEPSLNKGNICEEIDTVITPGIVFDRRGYRIGYGKGYYDRYLKNFPKQNGSNAVGLGYEFQLASEPIPYEPHDVKLNALITNKEVILT